MNLIALLILFPIIAAAVIYPIRDNHRRNVTVRLFAGATTLITLLVVYWYYRDGLHASFGFDHVIDYVMAAIEASVAIYIITISIKAKKYIVTLFAAIQTPLILWFEFTQKHGLEVENTILFDKLTAIMVLIIGIIGSLISQYSVGYLKWYHFHHTDYPERKNYFTAILFVFLSAMFGLVLSNSLMWLYFFWEITTLCSFLLIGYTKTEKAKKNSYLALAINMGGGLAFAIAIVWSGMNLGTLELSELIKLQPTVAVLVPVFLLSLAAMTKSAQLPFSAWLLGAMAAPTPSSALLHSATMVKAGVYMIIRLSPLLGTTSVGRIVTLVGSITFLATSLIAISQSDAKKILAYSTMANLGLIVTCASIGTQESLWAAILLVIFHAISKSLLFLTVGSIEHQLGSRDVEDMDILSEVRGRLALYVIIGIAGMFLAPFGMLISKWVAMKAFVDSKNILTVIILVFGSSATLFYWTKWMGKLVSGVNRKEMEEQSFRKDEEVPIAIHAILVVISCFTFPLISTYALVPFLTELFKSAALIPIDTSDLNIMFIMLSMLLVIPISFIPLYKSDKRRIVPVYMAGENTGDNETFFGAAGEKRKMHLRNWYMEQYFGAKKLTFWSNMLNIAVLCAGVIMLIGGVTFR